MRYNLNFQYIQLRDNFKGLWGKDKKSLGRVLQCIKDSDLLQYVKYFSCDDQLKKVNNIEEIFEQIKLIETIEDSFALHSKPDLEETFIDFYYTADFLELKLKYEDDFLPRDNKIIDKLIKLFYTIYEAFKGMAMFGPDITIWLSGIEYPRIKPPRDMGFLGRVSVVNFIHQEYFEEKRTQKPEGFNRLWEQNLPEGVSRDTVDNLVIIKWTDAVLDLKELQKIFMKREAWIYENIKLPLQANFNDKGDKLKTNVERLTKYENSFFSFYDSINGVAFKPLVLGSGEDLNPEIEITLKSFLKKGALENGDQLNKIVLILPDRKYVQKIHDKMSKMGISEILYIDDKGTLWNPYPEGNWL